MGRWFKSLLIASATSLFVAVSPTAGIADDRNDCVGPSAKGDTQIAACSRLIASGRFRGRDLAFIYQARADAYEVKKEFARALADYDVTISLLPTMEEAWRGRGRTHVLNDDHQRAVADFTRAIELNPKMARTYWRRGEALMVLNEDQRAMADLNHYIRLEPDKNADAYVSRGILHRRSGGALDAAIADHDQALRIDPQHSYGHIARAHALSENGSQERALRDADEAMRLAVQANDRSNLAHFYRIRGLIFSRMGNPVRAIADLDESLRLTPGSPRTHLWRGLAYEQTGDTQRALSDFRTTLGLNGTRTISGSLDQYTQQAHATARERIRAIETAPQVAPPPVSVAALPPTPAPSLTAPPGPRVGVTPGRRVALVIGNSGYRAVPALPNPIRDANAIANSLRGVGFQKVTLATDLSRDRLIDTLKTFAAEADGADWAMVYFAGHGIEVGGQNYILPIDAKLASDRDVQFEAVGLEQVMAATNGAKKLHLVMLDACRDNPFANSMRRTVASRSLGRGLAQIEPDAGSLVIFSAKHGQVALDGEGANSPFATAFVRRIATPGIEIRKLFDLVRDDVMAATNRQQQPYSYGSVPGAEDFYFQVAAR